MSTSVNPMAEPINNGTGEHIYELANDHLGNLLSHSVALVEIDRGGASTLHYHPKNNFEEVYIVIQGVATMILDEKKFPMSQNQTVVIHSNVRHKIINIGEGSLKLIVTCCPPWSPDCSILVEENRNQENILEPF